MSHLSGIVVCILGADERPSIVATIASARAYGLPVHVAVVAPRPLLADLEGVRQHVIEWNGDFASARNQLLDRVEGEYLLWLDSDERLWSFPELGAGQLSDDVHAIRWQAERGATPSLQLRLHRRDPAIRWRGRVHEQPCRDGATPYSARLLPGALIVHDGYEDIAVAAGKVERNRACVRPDVEPESLDLGEMLAIARHETRAGRFDFMRWLHVFRHPQARPDGLHYDRRHEAAYMLCSAGHAGCAQALIRANPLIVPLQSALLADGWRKHGAWDEARLDFLLEMLNHGFFDNRYPFPAQLLACDRDALIRHLRALAEEWLHERNSMAETPRLQIAPHRAYLRSREVLSETLDDDLVLMHQTSLKVVMLNPVAAVLWDALQWPMSLADLADLLREAHPEVAPETLLENTRETLVLLAENGLIEPAASDSASRSY